MRQRQAALAPFRDHGIAHRGLFDNTCDYPENTLAAFQRAVDAGYGVELDVHLTKDDHLVVAHDANLGRICGSAVAICDLTLDQLREYRVFGSSQTIPLFSEVLEVIAGKVPLVVEIKPGFTIARTCQRTDQELRDYQGAYCIESFDPRALWWFRRHDSAVLRGQLAEPAGIDVGSGSVILDRLLANLAFNWLTWPDFIAYNWRGASKIAPHLWRRFLRCTMVAWTIQTPEQLALARHSFDAYIFDSFVPDA